MAACQRRSIPRPRSGRYGWCPSIGRGEYSSLTACCDQVGRRLGLGKETVRRWAVQADIDAGTRPGVSTEESAEIKRLKAENRRLTEDLEIMRRA